MSDNLDFEDLLDEISINSEFLASRDRKGLLDVIAVLLDKAIDMREAFSQVDGCENKACFSNMCKKCRHIIAFESPGYGNIRTLSEGSNVYEFKKKSKPTE